VLLLVFLVSFTVSAILSLIILDEMDEAAAGHSAAHSGSGGGARRGTAPRADATLLRHSVLPLGEKQIAYRARLHALHLAREEVLPSRRGDSSAVEHTEEGPTGAFSLRDPADLDQSMLDAMGYDTDMFGADSDHSTAVHGDEGAPLSDEEGEGEYGSSSGSDEDASILFGGAGSALDGVSLWSLLWRSVGVDLRDWDVDISNITHTTSKPRQQQQQQQQQQVMGASKAEGLSAEGHKQDADSARQTADEEKSAAASDSVAPSAASASSGESVAASVSPSAPSSVRPRASLPIVSVLSDLMPQQGVVPYLSLTDGHATAHLALVHSFFDFACATGTGCDARWRVRRYSILSSVFPDGPRSVRSVNLL